MQLRNESALVQSSPALVIKRSRIITLSRISLMRRRIIRMSRISRISLRNYAALLMRSAY
jgi:hypothetical protein